MNTTAITTDQNPRSPDGDTDVGVERAERFAHDHPAVVRFGRLGWIAKGVVYGLTGVLALIIGLDARSGATSSEGTEASQTGAVAELAEQPYGTALLWVIAIGLILYSLWRLASVLLPADNSAKAWLNRAGYLVSAITYGVLAWTAISFARHTGDTSGSGSEDSKVETFTRDLMDSSLGRVAVFLIGATLIAIAAVFLWKAFTEDFRKQLMPGGVGPISERMLVTMGRIGWVGRSGMMGIIGFFLARAAIRFDPEDAKGLDGSLRKVADSDLGMWFVIAVGIGLLVYGAFCVVSAPKRRLIQADA